MNACDEPKDEIKIVTSISAMANDILSLMGQLEGLDERISKHWYLNFNAQEILSKRLSQVEQAIQQLDEHGGSDHDERIHDLENVCAEKRLIQLETSFDFEKVKELIYQGAQTHATILNLDDRIKKLESSGNYNKDYGLDLHKELIKLMEDHLSLQEHLNMLSQDYTEFKLGYPKSVENFVEVNIKNLHDRIDVICKNFDSNKAIVHRNPYKCPVCDGVGINVVIGEVRGLPIKSDKCHVCEGKGIVWG